MGDGKKAQAPCGHDGEHVVGNYVFCPICDVSDGVPVHVEPEQTKPVCPYSLDPADDCFGFGEIARWPAEFDKDGKSMWLCRECGRSFYA